MIIFFSENDVDPTDDEDEKEARVARDITLHELNTLKVQVY